MLAKEIEILVYGFVCINILFCKAPSCVVYPGANVHHRLNLHDCCFGRIAGAVQFLTVKKQRLALGILLISYRLYMLNLLQAKKTIIKMYLDFG